MKLQNKETVLLDGYQAELTGDYELVGEVEGTACLIVRCPNTNELFIIKK